MKFRTGSLAFALSAVLVTSVACAHRTPPPPASAEGSDLSKSRQNTFEEAVDSLHKQTNAPRADIAGVSQDDVTWNDSCLGCAKTGERCTQVLTPGYRIVLRVRDATYEYHADRGGKVRLCSQAPVTGSSPAPVVPPGSSR